MEMNDSLDIKSINNMGCPEMSSSSNGLNRNNRETSEMITSDFNHGGHSRSNSPTTINDESDKSNSKQDPKVCGVCGDKALGNNFNAITCESCKAFFRRNALKTKEFICPFNDNCKVDPITRRFCQKCRLRKCFDIGMKKEWIMTDEEKKMKKSKIEQNRLKRQSSDTLPMSNSSGLDTPSHKIPCLSINENSNPSTPGAVSLVMVSSPGNPGSNYSYPSNMQTPSPPDPTLPYTKGSKMAVTPTTTGHSHNHKSSSSSNFNDNNGAGLSPLMGVSGQRSNSALNNNSNKTTVPQSQLLTDHDCHQHAPAIPTGVITTQNNRRKYSNPNVGLVESTPLSSNDCHSRSNNNMMNLQDSEQQQQQQHIWCSGESSSSSSCSIPFSTSSMDTAGNNGSVHTMSSMTGTVLPSFSRYKEYQQLESQHKTGGNYKLLTSLIRPGITESPPDSDLLDCSTSNINPKASEDYSVIKQVSETEKRLQPDENSSEGLQFTHNHSQNIFQQNFVENEALQPLPLNTMDSILSVAIKAEFNAFGVLGGPRCGLQSSRELNNAERAKLNELLLASEALNAPVDAEGPIKVSQGADPSLINVINLTDIAIRRLIKMSKKISGFKNMCQEDQIALLKGSCTEMMILRSVVTYDPDRDSWNIPHTTNLGYNIKLGVLKEARGNLYEEHQRFARSFKSSWRLDENIMIILCAITLFTAERPNVIHKDVVKLEQDSYYYLLKRYLESSVSGCEARSTYLQLIGKIAELRNLNSNHLRVFLEVNPREVEPLLIEIFDLK